MGHFNSHRQEPVMWHFINMQVTQKGLHPPSSNDWNVLAKEHDAPLV